jgi:hypothetical protein
MVQEALDQNLWIQDIQDALTLLALTDYLEDWDLVAEVELQLDTPDSHPWRFTKSG